MTTNTTNTTKTTKTSYNLDLKQVRENPEEWSQNIQINILVALLKKASDMYYNSPTPLISDFIYDILYDKLQERDPSNEFLKQIGAEVAETITEFKKIELPIHMGSMTKIKSQDGVKNWLKTYGAEDECKEYVISDKLDGASALIIYEKDKEVKMYTRGNGTIGRDISPLVKYMDLPQLKIKMILRGELIVSQENFDKYHSNKQNKPYANIRAMVNGIIGSKTLNKELLKILDFVAFELVEPVLKPQNQFFKMKLKGFKLPNNTKVTLEQLNTWTIYHDEDEQDKNNVKGSFILKTLQDFKKNSKYDIDGIIVTHNKVYPRNTSGNPKHSFAFKANTLGEITKVVNVEWNTSKHGYLIPTVEIEPVYIGSTIKHASGFNAKYIVDNKLGPGSIVRVERSGDVIPHISEIIESTYAQMPTECSYIWNKTKVNILVEKPEENKDLMHKTILSFFRTLEVESLSTGLIKKLITNNYDSIKKIINMTTTDFLSMDGIKETMANKLYTNIHKIIDNDISLAKLMSASLCFGHGFGVRRFTAILNKFPNILEYEVIPYEMIEEIDGYSSITAKQFVDNVDKFKAFLNEHPMLNYSIEKPKQVISGVFSNKKVVLTGCRDKDIIEFINNNGGTISNSIKKDTFMLVMKDKDSTTSKATAAQLLGIPILSVNKFKQEYNL